MIKLVSICFSVLRYNCIDLKTVQVSQYQIGSDFSLDRFSKDYGGSGLIPQILTHGNVISSDKVTITSLVA
jgi:hypothetical protein